MPIACRISSFAWGKMEIAVGEERRSYKDCMIWPGGAAPWNWKETGTEHTPGIQPADLKEILKHDVEVIVFGLGVFRRLGVCPEILQVLQEAGIACHALDTAQAVSLFNELSSQGGKVGGLFHSTC